MTRDAATTAAHFLFLSAVSFTPCKTSAAAGHSAGASRVQHGCLFLFPEAGHVHTRIITLYSFPCPAHRVTLMLSLLGLPYRRVDVDLRGGEHKQPPFLALNAFGQVPVLEDEGAVIADSNAILVYLARYQGQARWLPEDALGAAAALALGGCRTAGLGPNAARLATLFGVPDPAARRRRAPMRCWP